jgi:hypothetical protein
MSPTTKLSVGEKKDFRCTIERFTAKPMKQNGADVYCVFANLKGEYEGDVVHIGGASLNGHGAVASEEYQIEKPVIVSLLGKLKKDGSVGTVVESIRVIEPEKKSMEETKQKIVITAEPEKFEGLKIVPSQKSNSKLKAKAPELVKPGKIKAVIYGIPGIGKTTLALSFPSPYYFDVEGGAKGPQYRELLKKSGGVYMGPEDGTLSFDTLIDQMQALATEKHPYKTLIVDSLTKLYQTTIAMEAERLGSKDAFGASKKPAIAAMRRLIMWSGRLDMNIWFICHETSEWGLIDGQRAEIGRTADVWDKTLYELDLSIQAVKRGPQRLAIVKKSRLQHFPDGETFNLDYSEFAHRHGKEAVESDSAVIVLATPAQVAEVNKLLSIIQIAQADIDKGFAKAGVEKWEEMTAEQIQVWINFLKKKISE